MLLFNKQLNVNIPERSGCLQERTLKEYQDHSLVKKKWAIADLTQLPRNGRARTDTCDGFLPTLTTNSGRLWSQV